MGYHKQRSLPSGTKKTARRKKSPSRRRVLHPDKVTVNASGEKKVWKWSAKLRRYLSPAERKDKRTYQKSGED